MLDEAENELWDRAEKLWQQWRESTSAGDMANFERLCAEHPKYASKLKRIQKQDAALAQLAHSEGAASGSFASASVVDEDSHVPTVVESTTDDGEQRTNEIVQRLSGRDTSFGKYHLAKRVGGGMSGAVFRVWDEDLSRPVALKLLHERYVDPKARMRPEDQRRARARFVDEARLTAQLDHPNIVPLHDFGITGNGRPYFTMKFVRGRTLTEIIQLHHSEKGPWTLTRTLGVFLKACEAVAYAHEKGVIHRDLKPSNIMVGRFGAVYVVDWGFVRRVDSDEPGVVNPRTVAMELPSPMANEGAPLDPGLTREGDVIGTPLYMSPEQARGENSRVGRKSDIYGLGAILYHLIAGTPPYQTGQRNLNGSEVVAAILSRPPDSIDTVAPRAPYELRRVIEKAMAREAGDRYRSVGEFSNDIIAFIEGRVGTGWGSRPVRSAVRWATHRPAMAGLAGLCLVLLGLLAFGSGRRTAQAGERDGAVPEALRDALQDGREMAAGIRAMAAAQLADPALAGSADRAVLLERISNADDADVAALLRQLRTLDEGMGTTSDD